MDRINKPKVFLSHSSLDKAFVDQLAGDLRKCQIDYWLDTEEIRDGRSWLKMIFEDGIPTCDAVIVYLTENSLSSKMVEKELDATVVEQLTKGGITLLPYVSHGALRDRLRVDIRTLHCREWNDSNYREVLPSVVGEIWRSYLERTVDSARLQERNRRLELELELKQLQEQYESSVFTPREEQEFQYLLKKLDREVDVSLGLAKENITVGDLIFRISILRLLLDLILSGYVYYDHSNLQFVLIQSERKNEAGITYGSGIDENIVLQVSTELLTYGLTELTRIQHLDRWEIRQKFTDKMYRFKYWLDYKNLISERGINQSLESVQKNDR